MHEITRTDYKQFLQSHAEVVIGETIIKLHPNWKISQFAPPPSPPKSRLELPRPRRLGNTGWELQGQLVALHPPNLILRYTAPGDLVFDQMAGSGTTLVECKLLGRCAVGVDINPDAVMVARNRLDFSYASLDADYVAPEVKTYVGDARCLDLIESETIDLIESETIDLIATHPPYASIIPYSHDREGDLSSVHNIAEFQDEMRRVAVECMRVLKPGKHCAILMGDSRRNKHFIPITPRVLMSFLEAGFILREDIIKMQWKMKSTREKWFGKKYDFYLIGHEHLYVFRKPDVEERTAKSKESMKWW